MIGSKGKIILVIGTVLSASAVAFANSSSKLIPAGLNLSGESIAAQSRVDETQALIEQLEAYEKRILTLEQRPSPKASISTDESMVALEEHQAVKHQLRQQITELESALESSGELIANLQKQSSHNKKIAKSSSASKAALKKIAGKLEQVQKKYNAALVELKSAKKEERQRLLVLEAQEREIQQLNSKYEQANRKVSESKDKSAKLKSELKSAKSLAKERDKLRVAIEKRDDLIDELEQELTNKSAIKKQNTLLADKIEQLEKKLSVTAHESNKLKDDVAAIARKKKLAESDLELAAERNKELAVARDALESRLENLKTTIETKDSRLRELNEKLSDAKEASIQARNVSTSLEQELKQKEQESLALRRDLAELSQKLQSVQTSNERLASSLEKAQLDLASKDEEYNNTTRQLSRVIQDAKSLENQISERDQKLLAAAELERELVTTKSALMLKQAEVSRLAAGTSQSSQPAARARLSTPERVAPVPAGADVVIAEILAKKANLRTGPGTEHSPLMQVGRGTRLTVESAEGDWFRVLTPTGSRAYVRQDVIRVINKAEPRRARRITRKPAKRVVPRPRAEPKATTFEDDERRAFESIKAAIGGRR